MLGRARKMGMYMRMAGFDDYMYYVYNNMGTWTGVTYLHINGGGILLIILLIFCQYTEMAS